MSLSARETKVLEQLTQPTARTAQQVAQAIDEDRFTYLVVGQLLAKLKAKGLADGESGRRGWVLTANGLAALLADTPAPAAPTTASETAPAAQPAAETATASEAAAPEATEEATATEAPSEAEIVLHLFKKPDGSIHGKLIGEDGEIGGVCAADADGVFDALEDSGQRYDRVEFHFDPEPAPATETTPEATSARHHTIALPGFTPIEVQGADEQLDALDALIKTLQESADALDESIGDLELERRQRAEEDAANQRFLERVTRIMGLENTAPNAKEQAIVRLADLANRELHRPINRPRHPLDAAFDDVIEQVTRGKGEQRHGKGAELWQQPWARYAETHGIGFLTGQAAKKLDEAQGFLHDQPRWEREMLGVIAYAGMAILKARLDVVAAMKQAV